MVQRMADLLARQAREDFVGRAGELAVLHALLAAGGPRVVHVHGIAGIGKSALLTRFAAEAQVAGAVVLRLDCRSMEPTEAGFLAGLGEAIGGDGEAAALAARLGALGPVVVLALDTFEVFRLMDSWLRQVFLPALGENVRVLFFGRERPLPAWQAVPGWGRLLQSLALAPLTEPESVELLARLGVSGEGARALARATHGHPLALRLAAAASAERQGFALAHAPLQHALDTLTGMFLADVGDPLTRRILEGVSVVRRTTVSLLRALFPDLAPQDAYERLRRLPFVDAASDGLVIHDAVREAIARSLRASDPSRCLEHQRDAWRQLRSEAASAGSGELWRYTADMLYLVENPVVREAFFPSGTQQLAVEPARAEDGATLARIVAAHEGEAAASALLAWWRRLPQAFSAVRGRDGAVLGLCCRLLPDAVDPAWLAEDPLTAQWCEHLARKPLAGGERALFCRRWLGLAEGEAPSEVQAASWLDLKRSYMELRPALRRVYLTVRDLTPYAPVALRLGFTVLVDHAVTLDAAIYHSAMLDFGPGSVDGWLAELAAAELGIRSSPALLDPEARELVLQAGRVALTPLEFELVHYLLTRPGKAVSRGELLRTVWGPTYCGGSNVVDAVVCTVRRKLGDEARRLETVSGVGYRLRPS